VYTQSGAKAQRVTIMAPERVFRDPARHSDGRGCQIGRSDPPGASAVAYQRQDRRQDCPPSSLWIPPPVRIGVATANPLSALLRRSSASHARALLRNAERWLRCHGQS